MKSNLLSSLINILKKYISECIAFFTNHKYIFAILYSGVVLFGFITVILGPLVPNYHLYQTYPYLGRLATILYISFVMYFPLYYWRGLKQSIFSYILFSINFIIFSLMLLGCFSIIIGLSNPIRIADLPISAFYRYYFFFWITVSAIIIAYILQGVSYYQQSTKYHDIISSPYVYEEIRLILYSWNEYIFGPICSYLMDILYSSKRARTLFLCVYLLFFIIIPLAQSLLFFYFVLFDGDLRWNIYLLPLSLISWIFRHLIYYFKTFFEGTCNYIRELIIVNSKLPVDYTQDYLLVYPEQLEFHITDKGRAFGLTDVTLPFMTKQYLQYAAMHVDKEWLLKKLAPFNAVILLLRCLSWFILIYFFWPTSFIESVFVPLLGRRIFTRSYATEAFQVLKKHQADLEKMTNNAYKAGHLIASDLAKEDSQGNMPYQAGLTHGQGTVKNPSKEIHPTKDVKGNPIPQRGTFTEKPTQIDSQWINPKPLPGSEAFFKDPIVDSNMQKHVPKEP